MIEFIGIIAGIAWGAVFIGVIMALAFGGSIEEEAAYALPPSAVDEEIARWREASDRTFARQGIRRVR